jgi:3-dehydroquinate dehydratase type I
MKFNICVVLPIKTNNYDRNLALFKNVINQKPEFIELRFDYIKNLEKITRELGSSLLNLVPHNINSIFTFRDSSEGGKLKISKKEKLKILTNLVEAQPDYIDIEMNSDKDVLNLVIDLAIKEKVNLIFSYHDFEKTMSFNETFDLISNFKNRLITKLLNIEKKIVYKVIFTAQNFDDNIIPIKLCEYFSNKNKKIISFCMGELGVFSRIACVKFGSFMTYCSLDEKTAPGQITIKKLRELYNLLFDKPS